MTDDALLVTCTACTHRDVYALPLRVSEVGAIAAEPCPGCGARPAARRIEPTRIPKGDRS